MTLRGIFLVLWARAWLALLVLATVVLVTTAVSLLLPKQYLATTNIIVNAKSVDPIDGSRAPVIGVPTFLTTQVDIIRSDRVANRVIAKTGLRDNPTLRAQWVEETEGRGDFDAYLATLLKKNLDVRPSRESDVIAISFNSVSPEFAAFAANNFAEAFVETSLELRVDPARRYASFFSERVQKLRADLVTAQNKLTAYQREKGIPATATLDIEAARMAQLSSQLAEAQGQSATTASRQGQASGNAGSSPDVINSAVVQQLRTDVARQSAQLEDLSARLGPNHPQYQQSKAQLDELKSRLAGEIQRAASAVASASRADAQREASLRASLDAQRRSVLASSSEHNALAVLQRDVDSAQKAYDAVTDRFNQSELEGAVEQTNVSILTPATIPANPNSPNLTLNIILALFLGSFLGIVTALVAEFFDRRVRSVDDLSNLGFPMLADLSVASPVSRWSTALRQIRWPGSRA